MIRMAMIAFAIAFSCLSATSDVYAQGARAAESGTKPPKMKMTTPIPEGIQTPDTLKTHLGTLTSFDGVPDKETTQKVYDNLDLQRATEAFLSTMQIASLNAMEKGMLSFGPANTTVLIFEDLMDSKSLWLTPNTVSIYMAAWMEIGDEPMVIETPPNVLGFIDDAWFNYVVDFGNAGPDKGKGGKFLILPPGYKGEVPAGYHVAKTTTFGNWVVWRGFQVDGSTAPAVNATKETFRMYPLSKKDDPPAMNFVNVSGTFHNTIHRMDYGFWEELDETIQAEPLEGLDVDLRGLLASIGIEKGKPFAPDPRMKKILSEAAKVASVTARALTARPKDQRHYLYPGERMWTNPFVEGRFDFVLDGARLLDSRAYMHFYATGITPAMAIKNVGKGSQYAIAYLDKEGNALDGSRTYKIHLPPNVPAKDFWSFTLYDNQTRSMLQTDQRLPAVDSLGKVKANADGSYDIYFGPKAPRGMENNWVQTIPGKGWNTIFRLYGPLQSFYDKTWKPSDPELVSEADLQQPPAAAIKGNQLLGRGSSLEDIKTINLRLTVDGRIALYGVQFDLNEADIKPESADTIAAIATVMKRNPDLKIAVVGHTDSLGPHEMNMRLSKFRADAVVRELQAKHNIAGSRLFAAGAGFLSPVAPNDTEEGRALNRRVELVRMK